MRSSRRRHLRALAVSLLLAVSASSLYLSPARTASRVAAQESKATESKAQASPSSPSQAVSPAALTPQEKRGKQIYVHGTNASGKEIMAYLGEGALEVPASTVTCASCHRADGQGTTEGGVTAGNITWENLLKPYGHTHPSGRKHPPYTERAVELAITRGLDPAGNRLLNFMPRYQMSPGDMADLIAYLKRLGTDRDPGLNETSIRIGMFAPAKGTLAELGQVTKAVVAAYFAEVNGQGGIYNRRIELKFVETGDTAEATKATVERFVRDEQIFALSSAMIAGADRELAALARDSEVPLVGPFTLYPPASAPVNRQVFYLLSGIDDQARALVLFAAQKFADKSAARAALVYPESTENAHVADALEAQIKSVGWNAPARAAYVRGKLDAAATVAELSAKQVNALFFLGAGADMRAVLTEAGRANWSPALYLPGALTGRDILDAPPSFKNKIYLSFPTVPADIKPAGLENFRAFAAKHKLPAGHVAAQISAYVSAQLLVEGLKRAGRDLSREKLVAALEGLYEYETGLTPPLTYGPNRRVGAAGAYIVAVDVETKQFVPASGWIGIK